MTNGHEQGDMEHQDIQHDGIEHFEIQKILQTLDEGDANMISFESTEMNSSKLKAFATIIKSLFSNKREKNYETMKANYSHKALEVCEKIEAETKGKVMVLADPEFVHSMSILTGATLGSYRGGGVLGKYVVLSDPKHLEDEGLVRHEAIHCLQQRELSRGNWRFPGFVRRALYSGVHMSQIKRLYDGLGLDRSGDFATDNQPTEYTTYPNQHTPGYLSSEDKRPDKSFLEHHTREAQTTIGTKYLEQQLRSMEQDLETMQKEGREGTEQFDKLAHDIASFKNIMDTYKDSHRQHVILFHKDMVDAGKLHEPEFQVWHISQEAMIASLPVEAFIQHFGKEEDNYKDGVDVYLKFLEQYPQRRTAVTEGFKIHCTMQGISPDAIKWLKSELDEIYDILES